jgi:NADH:ubiquinone oxidoreductase subunit 5 (subunit L)/multisubunit Na+/H+ antiporter MnhA subunit
VNVIYGGNLLIPATPSSLLWILLALPLLGALICGLFGRRIGRWAVSVVAVTAMVAATVAALVIAGVELLPLPASERCVRQVLWSLFSVGGVDVTFGLTLDALSAVMILVVTFVGTMIHVYAAGYLKDEPSLARFFAYLNLFVFSMLLLVLGDGFVTMLFGWEGVGVCSYLLIGFWYRRPAAVNAAMKAFIVNRVGDWGMLSGICLLLWGMGSTMSRAGVTSETPRLVSVDAPSGGGIELRTKGERPRQAALRDVRIGPTLGFRELEDQLSVEYGPSGDNGHGVNPHGRPFAEALANKTFAGMPLLFVVCVLLFVGAAGKSAQIPLFAWLPDAMAGPTPVSALIHAATMVTAGVYLIARLGFLFALSPGALTVIAAAGAMTAVLGATAGSLQWDLKRVLAFSTVSQLGFMFVAVGTGAFWTGVFHVVTHAFFKACLFLAAGSVIHAVNHIESGESSDPQDMRNMGGLRRTLPWSRRGYLVACVAIAGFPIAAGFYSKDQIFAAVLTSNSLHLSPALLVATLGVTSALTAFYMFRSYFLVFFARKPRPEPAGTKHKASRRMRVSMLILAAGSVVVALLGWPRNWNPSHAAPVMERWLQPVFASTVRFISFKDATPALDWGVQCAGLAAAVVGFLVARVLYLDAEKTTAWRQNVWHQFARTRIFISSGWGFDRLYRELAIAPARDFARATMWLDRRIFDPIVDATGALGMWIARVVGAFDRHVVDGSVNAVSHGVLAGGRRAARLQSGRIGVYVVGLTVGVAVLAVLAYVLGS